MRSLRNVLLAAVAALVVLLALAASAAGRAAVMPAAIQTTSYVWPQPPAWVGQVPATVWTPVSTGYVWPQPPSWVPIAG